MAKKKSKFRWFGWIMDRLRFKKKTIPIEEPEEDLILIKRKYPKGIEKELEDLRKKLSDFLLTSKTNSGKVIERERYVLLKTSPCLYKLEGTQSDGKQYSIILSTGGYLKEANGKITGLLHLSEAEINRAIMAEHETLESFIELCKSLSYSELFGSNSVAIPWSQIQAYPRFWKEQILLRLKPNSIALLLISQGEPFKKLFYEVSTTKQRKLIMDELFYLNQGTTSEEANPHSKNRNLMNYDQAIQDLQKVVDEIERLKNN